MASATAARARRALVPGADELPEDERKSDSRDPRIALRLSEGPAGLRASDAHHPALPPTTSESASGHRPGNRPLGAYEDSRG